MQATESDSRPPTPPDQGPQLEGLSSAQLTGACSILGFCLLLFCTGVLLVGKCYLMMDLGHLQTLALLALVFGGEATLYSVRERRHLWSSRLSSWVVLATVTDIVIITGLASCGIGMQALESGAITETLGAALVFAFALDAIKYTVFISL